MEQDNSISRDGRLGATAIHWVRMEKTITLRRAGGETCGHGESIDDIFGCEWRGLTV